ncbi:MAG: zinc ABC transporter substrate-binding protein [Ruminococcus sp.]|nr:zinc ABC transporter substrate-binding protein [Ruminococcus sp.]
MKKLIASFFVIIMMLSLASCNSEVKTMSKEEGKLNIVATIFPYYDFVRNITGDKANVRMLLSPGVEPHHYEPSPSDIIDINNSDLFIYTGGESDEWAESIVESLDTDVKVLKLIDLVKTYNEEETDKTVGEETDEHIWTSPQNAIEITKIISQEIILLDKNNSEYFAENSEKYLTELSELDNELRNITEKAKRNKIVFGDRFPILYFVKEYNLDYECAFPGCSSETEPGIATVNHLIDVVKEEKIPVVFYLDFSNQAVATLLCEDSNAKPMVFHSCHNITQENFNNGETYISLMKQNAQAVEEALN